MGVRLVVNLANGKTIYGDYSDISLKEYEEAIGRNVLFDLSSILYFKILVDGRVRVIFTKQVTDFYLEESDSLRINTEFQCGKYIERANILLKATRSLLGKQKSSHYVLNMLDTTTFYDEAECDGNCLLDDITTLLEDGV